MKIRKTQPPFGFIRKNYIKPCGITQLQLQTDLKIGSKTLSELYNHKRGISPLNAIKFGKYFDIEPALLMRMQTEYELEKTYRNRKNEIDSIKECNKERKNQGKSGNSNKALLISTVNNSISNKSKHYTEKDISNLFFSKRFTFKKKYAIQVLFSETSAQKIIDFSKEKNIPIDKVKRLYFNYKNILNGKRNPEFEWLFR